MKKLLLFLIALWLLSACSNQEKKEETAAPKTDDMNALYEKNLAVIKSAIASFEKKDIEGWAASVADNSHNAMRNSKSFFILEVLVLENGVSFKGRELDIK